VYTWRQLSQWDLAPDDAYILHKNVKTNLSKTVCRYMLVKETKQTNDTLSYSYVKKGEVSQSILANIGLP